ncbi:glycosyltransferase [Egicoccus halophilus]|uniref:glycosyltransferase n=1 Tax=Egicoccus halophilus TaxID=1670830 RepID=UPI00227D1CC7|nr:glycosyltransferase [Egicoccus halophilus]
MERAVALSRSRVLWVIKGLGLGGAERLLSLVVPRLDADRFVVDVAYVLPHKDALVPGLRAHGVRVAALARPEDRPGHWMRRLARLVRREGYDLVHTHSPVPAAVVRLSVPRSVTVVHTEHNQWERYRLPTRLANAVTYGRNDAVLSVSDGVTGSIRPPAVGLGGRAPETETLLHGVVPETAPRGPVARQDARTRLGFADNDLLIGCVANFTPKKDHAGLLEAFAQVHVELPRTRLLLVGTGPLEVGLRSRVTDLGLSAAVRFLGRRDDALDLLPALDVFVLGSRFEGLPIALIEAMAAEVACVATRVGGVPEAVRDGVTGRLVVARRPAALAGVLLELLHDEQQRHRLAHSGREHVAEHFSIDRAVQRTTELYTALLARGERP